MVGSDQLNIPATQRVPHHSHFQLLVQQIGKCSFILHVPFLVGVVHYCKHINCCKWGGGGFCSVTQTKIAEGTSVIPESLILDP